MALNLDGMLVLRSIGGNSRLFADVTADVAKAARALVIKQLKAKKSTLSTLQAVREAIGNASFDLIVDSMTDAEVKSLAGRFDKYHPELKTSDPAWRRRHLRALAKGSVVPAEKPEAAPKAKKPRKAKPAKRAAFEFGFTKATPPKRS